MTCTMVVETNTVFAWREKELVAMVVEEGGEPQMTVYGNRDAMRVLSFCDLEIIQDNWNQLQEMRRSEEKSQRIYKKGIDSNGGL